jgi:hypothetical protein
MAQRVVVAIENNVPHTDSAWILEHLKKVTQGMKDNFEQLGFADVTSLVNRDWTKQADVVRNDPDNTGGCLVFFLKDMETLSLSIGAGSVAVSSGILWSAFTSDKSVRNAVRHLSKAFADLFNSKLALYIIDSGWGPAERVTDSVIEGCALADVIAELQQSVQIEGSFRNKIDAVEFESKDSSKEYEPNAYFIDKFE